jgi:hypothetical protein
MKKTFLNSAFATLLITSVSLFSSCKKEENTDTIPTQEEALDLVNNALDTDVAGQTSDFEQTAKTSATYASNPYCGFSKDSVITKSFTGTNISYNYQLNWNWAVVCTQAFPNTINFNLTTSGKYETLRIKSDDNSTTNIAVTNLLTGSNYIANGSTIRNGTQTSKVRNMSQFTSKLEITYSNININKTSPYRIQSGNASFNLTGKTINGTNYAYSGTITFLGSQSATLTFANGSSFTIQL